MHKPYLIQRARIKVPLASANTRLGQAVDFDYMGSAEFEFGALPASFRAIERARSWVCRIVPEISECETPLRVWSDLDTKDFETYIGYLKAFRAGKDTYTKESVQFEESREQNDWTPNFWWDIDNHVMFGFKKEFMKRVGQYVAASLAYMNSVK